MVVCQESKLWGTYGLFITPSLLMPYLSKGPHSPTFNCTLNLNIFPPISIESMLLDFSVSQLVFPWQSKAWLSSAHSLPTQYSVSLRTNQTLVMLACKPCKLQNNLGLPLYLTSNLAVIASYYFWSYSDCKVFVPKWTLFFDALMWLMLQHVGFYSKG